MGNADSLSNYFLFTKIWSRRRNAHLVRIPFETRPAFAGSKTVKEERAKKL